jgi:hypothetical protein
MNFDIAECVFTPGNYESIQYLMTVRWVSARQRADAGPVCSGPGDAEWCQPGYICEKCSLNDRQFIWLLSDRHKSISCNVLKPNRLLPLLRFIVNIICKSNKGKWLK